MATGRSDYPNQINNVLGFPYIFRGALDVRATSINMEMKIAAAQALAALAREDVPDEVVAAYQGSRPRFGRDYIIPVPFDPRLISTVPPAVAKAAMDTGVARKGIADFRRYQTELQARRDPTAGVLSQVFERVRKYPKRVVFAEGEEEQVIRAALSFASQGLGTAILGRTRGSRPRSRRPSRAGTRWPRRRGPQRAAVAPQRGLRSVPVRATATARATCTGLPAAHQPGPKPLRGRHGGARRRGRDGHGRDPQLLRRA
jgi:hypothetical protein